MNIDLFLKNLLLLCFVLIFVQNGFCQNIQSITGKVVDENGQELLGNVLILNPLDSSLIHGSTFIDEPFLVENINLPKVILKLTSLMFADTLLLVHYNGIFNLNMGNIEIKQKNHALDEVVIKGKKQRIDFRTDGSLELNIENSSLASSNSIEEILSKTPGVIVGEDGYQIVGKQNVIFYVNGVRVTEEQLNLIQPTNIKKVEVIKNPSSRYDGDGDAVISIQTIGVISDGYQIKLKQNISHADFVGTNVNSNVDVNFAKGAIKLTGGLFYNPGKNREILHTTRDRDNPEIFLRSDVTTDWHWDNDFHFTKRLGVQYDLSPNNFISIEYLARDENILLAHNSKNSIRDNSSLNLFESNISGNNEVHNSTASLNFNRTLDTLGSTLFIAGQYSKLSTERNNDIVENNFVQNVNSNRYLKSYYNHDIDIYSGQLDIVKNLNSLSKIEIGVKFSQTDNDSKLDFSIQNDSLIYVLDNDLSSPFNYSEQIGGAYFNFQSSINDGLNYSIGLRSEYTRYSLDLETLENYDLKDNALNFFPYASVDYTLRNGTPLNITYSSSLRRPAYHNLNPVLYYQDAYTSIQGNPELKVQRTHGIDIGTSIFKTNINLGYNYTFDPLGARAMRGDDLYSYILGPVNYASMYVLHSTLSRTFGFRNFTSINSLNFSYKNITESILDVAIVEPRTKIYYYTNNIYNVNDLFNMELLFWYWGDEYTGITHRQEMYNLSLTWEKSFFNKALKCRITWNDILDRGGRPSGNYTVGETDIFFERKRNTEFIRLSLAYQFGNLKKIKYNNRVSGENELQRAQ